MSPTHSKELTHQEITSIRYSIIFSFHTSQTVILSLDHSLADEQTANSRKILKSAMALKHFAGKWEPIIRKSAWSISFQTRPKVRGTWARQAVSENPTPIFVRLRGPISISSARLAGDCRAAAAAVTAVSAVDHTNEETCSDSLALYFHT